MMRQTRRKHPIWSLIKCLLLSNLIAGFVACAYNVQIGMGIVSGTVIFMIVMLLLRILGLCPDRTTYWTNTPPPRTPPPPHRPSTIQKQEYVLVSNPDTTVWIGTRVFAQQPPPGQYPPPY